MRPGRFAPPNLSSTSPQLASARNVYEGKDKRIEEGRSAKSEAPAPSSPPQQSHEVTSVCDRYLRAVSRDTASVRCRVQFYNQELTRTLRETEALVSQAAGKNMSRRESCEQQSRLSPDVDGSAAARGGTGGGGGGESVVAEVSGEMAVVSGGGDGGTAGMSSTGPIGAFSRISPVGRADPSHPRMELVSRPGIRTLPAPSPSTRSKQAQDPGRGSGSSPKEDGSGGVSRRDSSGDEPKVAVSDRVAKLLLAALDESKAHIPSSSAAPPAPAERRKIAATPKNACFDPPSVRNGLTGLTSDHVDKVLLKVEASTPGAVSCWKSPVSKRRQRSYGTDILTPSTLGCRGLGAEAQSRRRRQNNISHESIGWFDAEGSARTILQEVTEREAAGGGGPGARRKKGGGGARRKRSIMKIKLPPRTPGTPSIRTGRDDLIQAAPATAPQKFS